MLPVCVYMTMYCLGWDFGALSFFWYLCIYLHMYLYIHIQFYLHIHVYVYLRIYIYIYTQIQIIYIHIHIHAYFSAVLKFLQKLWCGWVFLKRTQILSGIHFRRHFIECIVVETKQFVGNNINVILTRQTCGQRSSRAAESKRRALKKYFY